MLIASLVVDDQSVVSVRPGYVVVDDLHVTPTSAAEADRLVAAFAATAHYLHVQESAASMLDPEPDGPLAECELAGQWGDR